MTAIHQGIPPLAERFIIVVGAGPAGFFAAQKLAQGGAQVALLNRDLRPGGLAEYGVYPSKLHFKGGLRKQFKKILDHPAIQYRGGVTVHGDGPVTVDLLHQARPDAIVFTIGAQGTKELGLPGDTGPGVIHAKNLVYHYNLLPPFSTQPYPIGKRVAVIGIGNVMVDVVHHLIDERQFDEVVVVARRGPAERKYVEKEMRDISQLMDLEALDAEFARIAPRMIEANQNPDEVKASMLQHDNLPTGRPHPRLLFRFFATPVEVVRDPEGNLVGLRIEETKLVPPDMRTKGMGEFDLVACDSLVFAIGDLVDPGVGLPYHRGEYVTSPHEGAESYRVYDPKTQQLVERTYVAGWARKASDGLVGKARKDAEIGARIVIEDVVKMSTMGEPAGHRLARLNELLDEAGAPRFDWAAVKRLLSTEERLAKERGVEEVRLPDNEAMLAAALPPN